MPKYRIGKIIHYFPKIKVAVVKLTSGDLKVGDEISYVSLGGNQVTQIVESMQIEHVKIEIAKKGDEFGLLLVHPPKIKSEIIKA